MKESHSLIYGVFTKRLKPSMITDILGIPEDVAIRRLADTYKDFKLWDEDEDDLEELIDILDNAYYDLTERYE